METKQWISFMGDTEKKKGSQKEVLSTDFKKINEISVDSFDTGSTRIKVTVPGFWKEKFIYQEVDYDILSTVDSAQIPDEGSPSLPQEGVFIAIPNNAIFKELKVIDKSIKALDGKFNILPAPKPVLEGEELEYIENKELYNSDQLFPKEIATYIDTKTLGGKKVVHIMLYLAQYLATMKTVYAVQSLELEIVYETPKGLKVDQNRQKDLPLYLKNLVLDAASIPKAPKLAAKTKVLQQDTDSITLKSPDNDANFVIITVDALVDAFAIFQATKNFDYETLVVTKSQITTEFPSQNEYESIKDFLVYAVQNWNLPPEYVILGGNIDIIPTYMKNDMGENIPSDHYYSDISGDIVPEISVSRFPASTHDDMLKLCDTASNYNKYFADWRENVLLTTYNSPVYNNCSDEVADIIGNNMTVIKKYDGSATRQEVIDTIDAGVGFANYRGHGSQTRWQAGNGIRNEDVPTINNGNKLPQVLSIACLNNSLDFPGYFGSTWMKDQKAITFLGASRPSYTTINNYFDKYLWDGIIDGNLEKAGDIFNAGTAKLYQNYANQYTRHNIYMYLLLGDPTANYKEKIMPTQTTVGYVLMMDTSGSMRNAISTVKIDAKAFVRSSRPNDQFGINQFNNSASWVYPNNSNIVTVSSDYHETADAANAIESKIVPTSGLTNLGEAISLGNSMISQATTDEKAFVILSDGEWNTGPNPNNILQNEPPIFVAGLGPYLSRSMFEPLLAKNPNSQFYHQPNAWEMMQIFNDIRGLPLDTAIASNKMDTYMGSDYNITESRISQDSDEAQFSVVWSDEKYKYTSGNPQGNNINVQLIDPNGQTMKCEPDIVGDGYCIFNLQDVQAGTWRTLVQYSVSSQIYGTSAGFQFNTIASVSLDIDAPAVHEVGKPLSFKAKIIGNNEPIEGLTVHARLKAPVMSLDNAVKKHYKEFEKEKEDEIMLKKGFSSEIAKLHTLRMKQIQKHDILPVKHAYQILQPQKDGTYQGIIHDTEQAGAYSGEIIVQGIDPKTKLPFSRVKHFSTLVG